MLFESYSEFGKFIQTHADLNDYPASPVTTKNSFSESHERLENIKEARSA